MCGPCFKAMGSGRGRNPAAKHVLYRDGDLEPCRCSWAFGPAPSAALSWLRYPLCSRGQPDANADRSCRPGRDCPRKTADVRYCPPQTVWLEKYDPSHTMRWGRQDTIRGAYRQSARRGEVTRVVIPRPHPGTRGTNKAPIEPASQAGTAEAAAGGASAVVKPSADGFQDDCHPGAGPDRAHPDCAVEGRNRTREAGRPGRQSGHRVAGDRRPAGCDQTSGPTALPAPPSWQHDPSGSTQLNSGKSGQCQRSGGTDNMCCRARTGQQRYPIRRLTSGNGRDHGVDNARCPMPSVT
jgi:hypothetical protein